MPVFRFERVSSLGRSAKRVLRNLERAVRRAPEDRQRAFREREINEEISRLKYELRAAKELSNGSERLKKIKSKRQEMFRLQDELRADETWRTSDAPKTGTLPDFIIIGAQKSGTTSLYHLLTRHPHVEPAAAKEMHFFDTLYEEGVEWYRQCFPPPRLKDGRQTVTGEATPGYLFHPLAPERVAEVVPQARLIALLRNPVDRAYSQYHQRMGKGRENQGFDEAVGAENLDGEHLPEYLARGIYADQLLRWSRFFPKEQMLVLKSEDFFERPQDVLKIVLNFLDLPQWEPEAWKHRKKGSYEERMNPEIRRRLEDFFEPHNRRLYEYLGVDFGW